MFELVTIVLGAVLVFALGVLAIIILTSAIVYYTDSIIAGVVGVLILISLVTLRIVYVIGSYPIERITRYAEVELLKFGLIAYPIFTIAICYGIYKGCEYVGSKYLSFTK